MANKSSYSFTDRSARTTQYKSQSLDQIFEQQSKGHIHESMDPKNALLREARDSDVFPESLPVIAGLDITGSMDFIPDHMIKEGIPTLISSLHEKGITDAAVMFMGLGDSKYDKGPFQVGQFESSDEPMDLWMTRTWIEKGGGGNKGETYSWAWWFANNRCVSDAWEKRKQKGFIFTVGDDDCHGITSREFREVLENEKATDIPVEDISAEELYKQASKQWNVYHFNLPRQNHPNTMGEYMKENLIQVNDYRTIPELMAKIISSHVKTAAVPTINEVEPGKKITL